MGFTNLYRLLIPMIFSGTIVGCTIGSFENQFDSDDAAILGGDEVGREESVSKSVALLFNRATSDVCTVSILNNQFALTAAHCVEDASNADLSVIFDTIKRQESPTRRVVDSLPSNYFRSNRDQRTNTGDIALVRFAGGVPQGYQAAKFLPDPNLLQNGTVVTAVGYGVDNEHTRTGTGKLRSVNLQILNSRYSETELTLNQNSQLGVCHGDSGGPVYLLENGQYFLWGVVSRSVNPENCSEAAIITNSLLYVEWIRNSVVAMGRHKMVLPED